MLFILRVNTTDVIDKFFQILSAQFDQVNHLKLSYVLPQAQITYQKFLGKSNENKMLPKQIFSPLFSQIIKNDTTSDLEASEKDTFLWRR